MDRLIASLPDVARYDASPAPLPLDWVGMQGIDVPLILAGGSANALHARADIAVNLPSPHAKGIHMSRLYRLLDAFAEQETANAASLAQLLQDMIDSHADCHADAARIALSFSLLEKRPALATPGLAGWKSYPCRLDAVRQGENVQVTLETRVAYSSTCPCSAALSRQAIQDAFGHRFTGYTIHRQDALDWIALNASLATPHSQRSEAVIRIALDPQSSVLPLNELIHRAEIALGTPLQTAVKRADEQVFALLNGSNLMYVEDAARKLQQALQAHFGATSVSVRHMESLHPHDAVASVSSLVA